MAVTASNILFSAAAVRRLLGLSQSAKVQIQVWAKVVWVWVQGKRPTFMSKQVFKAHFVEWRKRQARDLTVTKRLDLPNHYTVRNEQKGSTYILEARSDGLFCTCDDFNNQLEFFGRGAVSTGMQSWPVLGWGRCRSTSPLRRLSPSTEPAKPQPLTPLKFSRPEHGVKRLP